MDKKDSFLDMLTFKLQIPSYVCSGSKYSLLPLCWHHLTHPRVSANTDQYAVPNSPINRRSHIHETKRLDNMVQSANKPTTSGGPPLQQSQTHHHNLTICLVGAGCSSFSNLRLFCTVDYYTRLPWIIKSSSFSMPESLPISYNPKMWLHFHKSNADLSQAFVLDPQP